MDRRDYSSKSDLFRRWQIHQIDGPGNTFLAARYRKKVSIAVGVPMPAEAEIEESLVVRLPVYLLGIDQRAVDIEDQRFDLHHAFPLHNFVTTTA